MKSRDDKSEDGSDQERKCYQTNSSYFRINTFLTSHFHLTNVHSHFFYSQLLVLLTLVIRHFFQLLKFFILLRVFFVEYRLLHREQCCVRDVCDCVVKSFFFLSFVRVCVVFVKRDLWRLLYANIIGVKEIVIVLDFYYLNWTCKHDYSLNLFFF